MMRKSPLVAIALEDNTALQLEDDQYRIINSTPAAKAYRTYWKKGEYHKEEIPQTKTFRPLKDLLKK